MRWHILRTLIYKEALRHASNRGGIALVALLLGLALLVAVFDDSSALLSGSGLIKGVHHCYIDYWQEDPWIDYLKQHVPDELKSQIHFQYVPSTYAGIGDRTIRYPLSVAAIQIRNGPDANGKPKVWSWYPGDDRTVIAPYENWFWRTTREYFRSRVQQVLAAVPPEQRTQLHLPADEADDSWVWRESHQQFLEQVAAVKSKLPPDLAKDIDIPELTFERSPLESKPVGTRTTIASVLMLFALFFFCVYLLPSMTCDEREHGVLLAQALSPASPFEIVAAKLIFYPGIAIAFAALLGGITTPGLLAHWFFWVTLVILAFGSLGIGMTIACVAKTQRSASMIALCYMLVITMLVLIFQQNQVPVLPHLFLEFHGPRLLYAAVTDSIEHTEYIELVMAALLAVVWNMIATIAFRRFGWQ
ncbi:MAG TPA: ABC transporter permease [Gemmataceae bacterium]|nr:ABC transporter permease [Gemmataceae bacterium]